MVPKMQVTEEHNQKTFSLSAKELDPKKLRCLGSSLAIKMVKALADKEKYPAQLAVELKENEQKIYYHIKNLEKAGVLKIVRQELVKGANAKFYKLAEPALVLKFQELTPSGKISSKDEKVKQFLSPFIKDGKLNARIIVGSPDPHGPNKARSRDGYYGMDLALFLGTFMNYVPQINVRLDTETKQEELTNNNLILIGGPIVNTITEKFNKNLPINFTQDKKSVYSKISKTFYNSDEIGIIVKTKNPYNPEKSILVVAGKRQSGTRASIMAFLKGFKHILEGNKFKPNTFAKVVEGLDLDSDGVVDSIEFRE